MNHYLSLSLSDRRQNLTALQAFNQLIEKLNQPQIELETSFRRSWIRIIILDLSSGRTDWTFETIHRALVTLKLLGRSPVATDDLASHLTLFTRYANLLPLLSPQSDEPSTSNNQILITYDSLIAEESLRILANTLFLHPHARSSEELLPAIPGLVEMSMNDQSMTYMFLASRVLFLITAAPSGLIVELVNCTSLVIDLTDALKRQMQIKSPSNKDRSKDVKLSEEVLIEYLKIIFNLMVQYPPSMIEHGRTPTHNLSTSPFLGSNSRQSTFNNSSSTDLQSPPLGTSPDLGSGTLGGGNRRLSVKQRFVNQLNRNKLGKKFKKELESGTSSPLIGQGSEISSVHSGSPRVSLSVEDDTTNVIWNDSDNKVFAPLLPYLIQLFLYEPISKPPSIKPPLSSYIHTFLNFPACPSFYFTHYKSNQDYQIEKTFSPVISKLIDIIDKVTEFYCPNDPDSVDVKQRCEEHDMDLDIYLTQVMVLLVNLLSPAKSSGITHDSRKLVQERLVPKNIDRSIGLNKQANCIGRILRLMNSIKFNSLKVSAGGFLYALYNEDADHLVSQVGYGPIAGYLMSIGKPGVNGSSSHQPPRNVNPVTGAFYAEEVEESTAAQMTDQEKEAEAERLCDLFDRMNRNGVIKVEDPRRAAVESGKFDKLNDKINEEMEDQDLKDEQEALEEMRRYKARLKNTN
ncbi:hypothetical protein CROQUDRAFT_662871 [Cronartium quercuum f. sp. fusiforme G11]|uniref:Synembryn-A n=1 Tax=Cronartium quercuum f. sp. fusiforme G11 TaxID=708437 RepID=A0A9P6N900_9BASI|nr:hypothetical protein CROQUDRAFT_662871 [Cronartium quercuum f. sp. fusiforme G11]